MPNKSLQPTATPRLSSGVAPKRMNRLAFAIAAVSLLVIGVASATQKADLVRVKKSDSTLRLLNKGVEFASFHVAFGANPNGHKEAEGDERTPEGRYVLDYKKDDSSFYKAIHISYPNDADRARAVQLGVKPGGAIMVHGQKNGMAWLAPLAQYFNWTNGCIALRNEEMDLVWEAVDAGTPIEIEP